MNQQYYDVLINGGRAIPGSSLTRDPENPAPYEKPPEYVSIHKASEWIFSQLIDEDNYEQLIQTLLDDIPIMDVAQVLLFKGFTEGKWTVDLMMLLAEPTAYMILALAERAGVDPVIFRVKHHQCSRNCKIRFIRSGTHPFGRIQSKSAGRHPVD